MTIKNLIDITYAEWEDDIAFYNPHGTIYDIIDNADEVQNHGAHKIFIFTDGTAYRISHIILDEL